MSILFATAFAGLASLTAQPQAQALETCDPFLTPPPAERVVSVSGLVDELREAMRAVEPGDPAGLTCAIIGVIHASGADDATAEAALAVVAAENARNSTVLAALQAAASQRSGGFVRRADLERQQTRSGELPPAARPAESQSDY